MPYRSSSSHQPPVAGAPAVTRLNPPPAALRPPTAHTISTSPHPRSPRSLTPPVNRRTPPTFRLPNFPTSQQIDKPESRQVGKHHRLPSSYPLLRSPPTPVPATLYPPLCRPPLKRRKPPTPCSTSSPLTLRARHPAYHLHQPPPARSPSFLSLTPG